MIEIKQLVSVIILHFFSIVVDASFYVPKVMDTLPFIGGMTTALRNNNTLYMFGDETPDSSFNNNNFYQLTKTDDTFE
jgi:hypothetical protein